MIIVDHGSGRMEIDDYGRIYGVGDNIYGDTMEALLNVVCHIENSGC
jgi:hypothetical protein